MATQNHYGMPFRLAVTPCHIQRALDEHGIKYRRRLFDPQTTIYAWMSQIASSDRSCRHAVAEIVARCAVEGKPVSARTGGYAQARQRLDIRVIKNLARDLARRLEDECSQHWLIDRPVFSVDGTTVSCPDTKSITGKYPKQDADYAAEGLGFPTIRLMLIGSQTTGAIIDMVASPYKGQHTNEIILFRKAWDGLQRGDVIVGDRAYASPVFFYLLPYRGIDLIARRNDKHLIERFNTTKQLGRGDHVLDMQKPPKRPQWMTSLQYRRIPRYIETRYTSIRIDGTTGKTRLELLSSLTDSVISKMGLAELYENRWSIETDFRSIKQQLGAGVLRCKSAEMIEKELWMTVLTNNAIRYIAARAATRAETSPRSVSFTTTMQAIRAFAPRFRHTPIGHEDQILLEMLEAIAAHEVGNRPGRVEPRAVKRRPKKTERLRMSREDARRKCRRGKMR